MNASAEQSIEQACRARDFELAITQAFSAYGAEIATFISARLRSASEGDEAFSMFAEDLCRALPSFEFRCSVRGYLYAIARNAAHRYASEPHRRRERHLSLDDGSALSLALDRVRTETAVHRRTEVKDKVRVLREHLSADDQALLTLHIDRALPWAEIAMVMRGEAEPLTGDALVRETARLRKRFERVKAELRVLAIAEGLLAP